MNPVRVFVKFSPKRKIPDKLMPTLRPFLRNQSNGDLCMSHNFNAVAAIAVYAPAFLHLHLIANSLRKGELKRYSFPRTTKPVMMPPPIS